MKVIILGCYGSEFPAYHLCSFLINDSFVLDAGSITSTLSFNEQKKIKHILITHSHLDHIKDIAFLADNLQKPHTTPINLISSQEVLDVIKTHLFNKIIWPDFSKLPDPEFPILKYHPIPLDTPQTIDELEVNITNVNHTVPTVSYLISDKDSSILFTADMGPSEKIWEIANKTKNLKAIFIDTAFPNSMQEIADKSKHLTPQKLKEELKKLKKSVAIYSYHLKSRFENEIKKEIEEYCPQVNILKEGKTLTF